MEIDPGKINYGKMVQAKGNMNALNTGKKPEVQGQNVPPSVVQGQNVPSAVRQDNDTVTADGNAGADAFSEGILLNGKKLFDMSLDMFKERLGKFLALVVLAVVALSVMDLAISLPLSFFFDSTAILKYNIVHLYFVSALISIVVSIPSMILGISIIETIKDQNLEVRESIKRAFGKFKDYLSAFVIGNFIYSGIILLVPAVALIQFITSGEEFSMKPEAWGMSFLIIIIGFILILPLLYIVEIWIFITLLSVILDGLKPFEAFSYGYELIKGKASQIFWRMISLSFRLFIYIIVIEIAFGAAVGIPAGILISIAGQNSVAAQAVSYLMNVLSSVVDLGITSFALVFQYNIYQNLKAIRKDLPQDYRTMHQGTIKIIVALGLLLTGMFLTTLVYYAPVIDSTFRKEVMTEEFMKENGLINASTPAPGDDKNENTGESVQPEEKKEGVPTEAEEITGRDLKRKDDLGRISLMAYSYREIYGNFPVSPVASKLNEENEVALGLRSAGGEDLPRDPKDPEYYYAYKSSDGQNFELSARLEDLTDPLCDQNVKSICLYVGKF
ncbi:MAG: hypothetical protein WC788_00440 [Candidatus Paceibacterota bacterium]|jgi:hypothetical protein